MLKIAELIELADLFDRWGHKKAADKCDELISNAAMGVEQEINLMKLLAAKNFETVKEQIKAGASVLILTPVSKKLEGNDKIEASFVEGKAINAVDGQRLDFRRAAIIFEAEKNKLDKDGAVMLIESGGVKYIHPKDSGMELLKKFFNKTVTITKDPSLVEQESKLPPPRLPHGKKRWKANPTTKEEFREKTEQALKEFDKENPRHSMPSKKEYERLPKGHAPRHSEPF